MIPKETTKITEYIWELPSSYKPGMRVPARIYASKKLLEGMDEGVFDQVTNVAFFPGLVGYSLAMPDAHWGYGAPIGAVFATDPDLSGIISPGSVGFDINCGMRLITTNLTQKDVQPHLEHLINRLFEKIPTGVGAKGFLRLRPSEFDELMERGAQWVIDKGFGWAQDRDHMEESGMIGGADPTKVSERARERGLQQLGTLGSGNHYLEVQVVKNENIYDKGKAQELGILGDDQIVVMVHCGSRGFGHQVATDYLRTFTEIMPKYNIRVPDPQLSCAPFESKEGQDYYHAMACAANNAFANRQLITHRVREVFSEVFGKSAEKIGMQLVYDVAHNIAKLEEHTAYSVRQTAEERDSTSRKPLAVSPLVVHRKGATRSFPGQPVIIGGSMETGSYLLLGTDGAMQQTFGSTAHGSGRTMSRAKAKRMVRGEKLQSEMKERGILVKSASLPGLAEEAGLAYKDIAEVVEVVHNAGISRKVVRFVPIGNIKG